jgi:hypothetical protein
MLEGAPRWHCISSAQQAWDGFTDSFLAGRQHVFRPAAAQTLVERHLRVERISMGLDQLQFGGEQAALRVELVEIGGIARQIAVCGEALRDRPVSARRRAMRTEFSRGVSVSRWIASRAWVGTRAIV